MLRKLKNSHNVTIIEIFSDVGYFEMMIWKKIMM